MINPAMLFRLKSSWERFTATHPKFPLFLQAASKNDVLRENTILEINITTPEGRDISTNLKLTSKGNGTAEIVLYIFIRSMLQAFGQLI